MVEFLPRAALTTKKSTIPHIPTALYCVLPPFNNEERLIVRIIILYKNVRAGRPALRNNL